MNVSKDVQGGKHNVPKTVDVKPQRPKEISKPVTKPIDRKYDVKPTPRSENVKPRTIHKPTETAKPVNKGTHIKPNMPRGGTVKPINRGNKPSDKYVKPRGEYNRPRRGEVIKSETRPGINSEGPVVPRSYGHNTPVRSYKDNVDTRTNHSERTVKPVVKGNDQKREHIYPKMSSKHVYRDKPSTYDTRKHNRTVSLDKTRMGHQTYTSRKAINKKQGSQHSGRVVKSQTTHSRKVTQPVSKQSKFTPSVKNSHGREVKTVRPAKTQVNRGGSSTHSIKPQSRSVSPSRTYRGSHGVRPSGTRYTPLKPSAPSIKHTRPSHSGSGHRGH